jgi:hypothetical protein
MTKKRRNTLQTRLYRHKFGDMVMFETEATRQVGRRPPADMPVRCRLRAKSPGVADEGGAMLKFSVLWAAFALLLVGLGLALSDGEIPSVVWPIGLCASLLGLTAAKLTMKRL